MEGEKTLKKLRKLANQEMTEKKLNEFLDGLSPEELVAFESLADEKPDEFKDAIAIMEEKKQAILRAVFGLSDSDKEQVDNYRKERRAKAYIEGQRPKTKEEIAESFLGHPKTKTESWYNEETERWETLTPEEYAQKRTELEFGKKESKE